MSEGTGFVLIGPPSDGKTRTLYEVLRRMDDYEVIRLKAGAMIPKKADLSLLFKERRVVLLLDDLSNAKYREPDLLELTERLGECKVASWIVASTCQNGPELTRVRTELGRLYDSIGLELWLVGPTPQQKEKLAESIWREAWDPAKSEDYPTLGYIAMGEQAMKPMGRRFANLSTNHSERAATLRALKLLDFAGVLPSHELLRAVLRSEGLFQRRDLDLHESLAALVDQGFLRPGSADPVQPEPGYLRHDSVVPYVRGRMPEDDLDKLAYVLEELEDPGGLLQLSITCMRRLEAYERALGFVDRVLRLSPDLVFALYSRGIALELLGRYEEALEKGYDKALKVKPDDAGVFQLSRGGVLAKLGRHEEALEAYNEALKARPDPGDEEALETLYNEVLKARPAHAGTLNNNFEMLELPGRYEKTYNEYLNARRPDHAVILLGKGNALLELGRREEALEAYNEALKVRPTHVGTLNNKGLVLLKLGRHEVAMEAFDEARRNL